MIRIYLFWNQQFNLGTISECTFSYYFLKMKKTLFSICVFLGLSLLVPTAAMAGRGYQIVSWTNPDLLNCYQMGTTSLGVPVWQCFDPY